MNNKKLNKAKRVKDDEFYTPYEQFECWLKICLLEKLEDKIIYCGWIIEKDKDILYLVDSILIFNKIEGKGLIISPKEIEKQFSFSAIFVVTI